MPYRLTKIYTRKGDNGYTTLGDKRIPKDDFLVEAIGSLDELNSHIGFVLALQVKDQAVSKQLTQIQNDLFELGAELHLPERIAITKEKVTQLEHALDQWNSELPPLKEFLLPGGNPPAAAAHVARTVCRRTERSLVRLHRQITLSNIELIRYLNRLSDLLFVIARILARESHAKELMWDHEREKK